MDELSNLSRSQWVLFCLIIIALIYYFATDKITSKKTTNFETVLKSTAKEINKSCPYMIDKDTRLDNVTVFPGNTFQYNYTLVTLRKSDLNIDYIKNKFEPQIINGVKSNPDLKVFRDCKTTIVFNYNDKEGTFIYRITVTPDLYN
jgi:hypothetical protein